MMDLLYLRNVTTLHLDRESCTGCRLCTQVCPRSVLSMEGNKARIVARDACIECGACSRNCLPAAITVRAGVGCAAALINGALGRKDACCVIDAEDNDSPSCC